LNLGNYFDYIVGPPTSAQHDQTGDRSFIHMTQDCENFFDVRFRHEFVWYSSHYFPVYENGGAKYWDARRTVTNNSFVPQTPELYDAGAWTGHKDDIEAAEWAEDPYLRWGELYGWTGSPKVFADGRYDISPFLTGGYRSPGADGTFIDIPAPTGGATNSLATIMGTFRYIKRANFFADTYDGHRMRLAVGPRTPESRDLIINLVLPTDLTDL
jgi:hypothetical protein